VSKIISVSKTVANALKYYYGIDKSRIEVIPNGVDPYVFKPEIDTSDLKIQHSLDKYNSIILCLARISPYKGQFALVKAIKNVVKAKADVVLLLVGPISDIAYYNEIQKFIFQNNLKNNVVFTGKVSKQLIPKYYALADVFVLPSIAEASPLALLEAMSSGKAIVASSIPQNRELAIHGDEMLYVNPNDIDALSRTILAILEDKSLKVKLGKNARRTVVEFYDWDIIASKILDLYYMVSKP
jgi:glycosyltransferase involved in cell wall biosynthesis